MCELQRDQSFETGCALVCLWGVMVHAFNPCPEGVETGASAQGHPCLFGDLRASLGYMRSYALFLLFIYCLHSDSEVLLTSTVGKFCGSPFPHLQNEGSANTYCKGCRECK